MQGKQLRKLEAELWRAADQLRANSKLTASEYSMPVLGLIFLRHAYNRFQKVKIEVERTLPSHPQRGKRELTKKDFEEQNSMFLPDKAQFDYLVSLPESADIGEAIDNAMKLIEDEYDNLKGVLPKNFSIFSKDLLRELLRIFNKEVLQKAEGDLFGKIYEYFLGKFAMTGAQEGGEFFTPMSLVQTIVNVIEPDHGIVFDPACGSAGMFVQTGYFIESEGLKPAEKVTFYGQEKADLNTKLAKMNLTVHGLEGNIQEGNTFYEDKHNLVGGADFVMANPPFNVDGVDKAKDAVKKDPRLLLDGKVNLPKNDNANYLWIQYFYNYLKATGRAGFVMASSASDAGHSEKDIREKLVKTGAVDVMMAIGNNFFYTRSLPCTLWFFDRGKELLTPSPSTHGVEKELLTPSPSPHGEGKESIITVERQLPKQLLENARALRKNQTEAEELLWQLLRDRQLNSLKFRRQHPLKVGFVLDFFCSEAKLGIEVDGGYHTQKEQQEYDAERTKIINEYGIRIIRFTNEQVLLNTEQVLNDIASSAIPPSPNGEGLGVRNKNTVLMLDARKIYRKVTSKVNDFSPEQLQNLICIVNLYRGNSKKFESTVKSYLQNATDLAKETAETSTELQKQLQKVLKTVSDFATKYAKENKEAKAFVDALNIEETTSIYEQQNKLIVEAKKAKADIEVLENIAHLCKALRKPQDKLIKQLLDVISTAAKEYQLSKNKDWKELILKEQLDQLKALQQQLSGIPNEEEPGLLHETEYFYKQAHWLTSRFPDGFYTDVEGLCKVVNQVEIEAKDWSLSPGRYVGVDTATDDDFDYEERLNEIHIELEGLNEEAFVLANVISENFKELAI
ncbi:MAG: N-6 DNA methylase [Saprospiraceae bacterium]|nr:N-6 DNA methylase [Saprospiraceae bacterium]